MKKCTRCKVEKELGEFQKNKGRPDGLQSCCKSCMKIYEDRRRSDPQRVAYENKRGRERWANMSQEEKDKRHIRQRIYDKNRWKNDPEFKRRKPTLGK